MKRYAVTLFIVGVLTASFATVTSGQTVIACGDIVSASIDVAGEDRSMVMLLERLANQ